LEPAQQQSVRGTAGPRRARANGYTFIELVIALAILALIVLIGYPSLHKMIARSQLRSLAQEIAVLLRQARLEAIGRGAPAVVRIDVTGRELTAFVDIDDAGGNPGADLVYTPRSGVARGTTDYVVGVRLLDVPLGGPSADPSPVAGFTDPGDGPRIVFQPDGSVADSGGLRYGDARGNYLEVGVRPATTGRIEVRKWDRDAGTWRERGRTASGGTTWTWYD
jgi:prepilin-type N-terminal cleavage/methylation domain-containing protein